MSRVSSVQADPRPTTAPVEVAAVSSVTPRMRRLTFAGAALEGLDRRRVAFRVKLSVPDVSGEACRARVYTVRSVDWAARTVDVDVVLHGNGPVARWAADAGPGSRLWLGGPRGGVSLPVASSFLFVGDETALPAICAMLEVVPAGASVRALIEVPDLAERQPLVSPGNLSVSWLPRRGREEGDSSALLGAVRAALEEAPSGGYDYGWVAAESSVVQSIRSERHREEWPNQAHVVSYWRRGEAAHREVER